MPVQPIATDERVALLAGLAQRAQTLLDEVLAIPENTTRDEKRDRIIETATELAGDLSKLHEDVRRVRDQQLGDPRSIALLAALDAAGYDPKSYSGRAMYPKKCVSVSGDDLDVFALGRDLASENIPSPRLDSMGIGTVAYWPSMPWPESRVERFDDEDEEEVNAS